MSFFDVALEEEEQTRIFFQSNTADTFASAVAAFKGDGGNSNCGPWELAAAASAAAIANRSRPIVAKIASCTGRFGKHLPGQPTINHLFLEASFAHSAIAFITLKKKQRRALLS